MNVVIAFYDIQFISSRERCFNYIILLDIMPTEYQLDII